MISEARSFEDDRAGGGPFRIGVSTTFRPLPAWKQEADMLFAQVTFSAKELLDWRSSIEFDGPVFAGVMVVASAAMGRRLGHDIPQLAVPDQVIDAIDRDRNAGVAFAVDLIAEIEESGVFDGVHLVPVNRYREIAALIEARR